MDHDLLADHLEQAEHHVEQADEHIARQTDLIAWLETRGHDATEAKRLLVLFQEIQATHIADRDRLRELVLGTQKPN